MASTPTGRAADGVSGEAGGLRSSEIREREASEVRLGPGREFDLIRELASLEGLPPPEVTVGIGDDCAVLAGEGLVVSGDLTLEDVHFRRVWLTRSEIGYRAAAAALSDLAAVAARPLGVLASLGLPADNLLDGTALRIQQGIHEAATTVGAGVIGGDVSRSPRTIVIQVTVLGRTERPVLRRGARAGDELWVTGRLGGAAATLELLSRDRPVPRDLRVAFARPRPRIEEARWLAAAGLPHAMVDLSDGLSSDAQHLGAASGVGIVIERDRIPVLDGVSAVAGGSEAALRLALHGGEDYELLFAAAAEAVELRVPEFRERFSLELTRVGRVVEGSEAFLEHGEGELGPLAPEGFDHLRGEGTE